MQQTLFVTRENQSKSIEFSFDMTPDGVSSYTLDFDLRKSIEQSLTNDELFLIPTIRIINNANAAKIAGIFSEEISSCSNASHENEDFERNLRTL